jgi:hypothetical protein
MKIRRWIRRVALAGAAVVAIVVLVLIAVVTIDLGPTLRERAEREGSKLIERPLHIGSLGIRLRSGNFVIENLRIEGLTPADHPFFTAKRIEVSLYWWTFFGTRELLIKSVDMSDWDMQVELKNGGDSFIKIPKSDPGAKRSYTVTVARVDAVRGRFTYIDHGTWSTASPNLSVHVDHDSGEYRGRANFSDGVVRIKAYEPMRDDMRCSFTIDGGKVHLNWIDLTTDGSHSVVSGDVDFGHWPEMLFRVRTDVVNFARMRQIFFANETFRVAGEGKFTGTFHLYKRPRSSVGRDLQGSFSSPLLTINGFRFPDLTGDLRWLPDRFNLTNGAARFHGGTGHFTYSMAPLGVPQPAVARFDTSYESVDLASLTDYLQTQGMRVAGRATGRNILEWPLGRFREHRGAGEIAVRAPAEAQMYSRTSPPLPQQKTGTGSSLDVGVVPSLGYVPMAGTLRYEFGPEWIDVGASSVATPSTAVDFSGRTAYGERSSFDFFARSGDWQESDKLLAAVITAFGSRTRSISVGGYGDFTGRMLNSFKRPRIEGAFTGEQVRAFDVIWGTARGQVVVDNGYVDVTGGIVTKGGTTQLRADGRFSLSTPRDDGGEEINARVSLRDWPIPDLRHAFDLDAYPIDGRMGGEYHVHGAYRRPFGEGTMTVTAGSAYSEPFERGTGSVRLEGVGVRINGIQIAKGGGTISGSAYVSWDGKYSFDADGHGIPVEQIAAFKFPGAPLSGIVRFAANGSASFANPHYEVKDIRIADLFVGDEGIGQVTGTVNVQDQYMAFGVEAASPRLNVSGAGRISLLPGADAEMSFRVTDTSLDPYLRTFQPGAVSPFTSAIASGTVHARGSLTDLAHLVAEANVEQLDMRLFDYTVTNAKGRPLQIVFENNVIHLGEPAPAPSAVIAAQAVAPKAGRPPLVLVGQDTRLELSGDVNLRTEPYVQPSGVPIPGQSVRVHADGDANLGILQGVFPDIRSSGSARLSADVQGPLRDVAFTGQARVANGRIRYFSLPHSIDAINGPITFTAGAIWLGDPKNPKDELTAQIGGGPVTFSGRMDLNGFAPSQWAVTASGTSVHLRYPDGFNSVVDGDLSLTGPYAGPTLHGTVTVRSAVYSKQLDITPALAFAAAGAGSSGAAAPAASALAFPLRFDIRILAPSTLRLENNLARDLVANADLTLQGTYDHPLLLGQAEVERGYITFEGKRYTVTHGAVEFNNPARIDPFFDFETETRVRVPGQSYFVDLHVVGTVKKLDIQLTSDPPLPQPEIAALLLGDIRNPEDVRNAELLALQRPNAATQDVLRERLIQLFLSPGTTAVNRAFENAFRLSTFQITPSLFDEFQRLSPSARVTIGKQISSRAYLTISRSLYAPQEDIIYLLEYDQSDRVSWVLSRNEDKTYALDVRVRHTF